MSDIYIQRLRSVRNEFEAARQGLAFVDQNWHKYGIYNEVDGVTLANIRQAKQYLFSTYLVRLSAEFEGTLKCHLALYHSSISIPKDAKVDWLISKVSKAENFNVDTPLRANLDRVRKYRNEFVHSGQSPASTFDFGSALSWFNTFLAKLS